MDINRLRLTIGVDGKFDPKGKALTDKGQKVEDFFTKDEQNSTQITFIYKDLGR